MRKWPYTRDGKQKKHDFSSLTIFEHDIMPWCESSSIKIVHDMFFVSSVQKISIAVRSLLQIYIFFVIILCRGNSSLLVQFMIFMLMPVVIDPFMFMAESYAFFDTFNKRECIINFATI